MICKKQSSYMTSSESAIYISIDIECSGFIPAEYSMLSLGACVVGNEDDEPCTFYIEMQPISDNYVKEALEIAGFSMQNLKVKGIPPKEAMEKFADWIAKVSDDKKPVFVASPIAFDCFFFNCLIMSIALSILCPSTAIITSPQISTFIYIQN